MFEHGVSDLANADIDLPSVLLVCLHIVYARFVYRLGHPPFTQVRGVRFPYRVPNVPASLDTLVPEDEKCYDKHGRFWSSLTSVGNTRTVPVGERVEGKHSDASLLSHARTWLTRDLLQLPPRDAEHSWDNNSKCRYRYRVWTHTLFGLSRPGTGPDTTGPGFDTVSAGRLNWHFLGTCYYGLGLKVFMDARRPVTP